MSKSYPYDAILVLGCGINADSSLPSDPKASVQKAADLYFSEQAPLIVMSGALGYMANFTPLKTESVAMQEYALQLGVPPQAVIIENDSKDTVGNAYFTKVNVLLPRKLFNILVIQEPNHSKKRVHYILKKVLGTSFHFKIITYGSLHRDEAERERKALVVLKKWTDSIPDGDHEALYHLMITKHPAYCPDPEIAMEALRKELAAA